MHGAGFALLSFEILQSPFSYHFSVSQLTLLFCWGTLGKLQNLSGLAHPFPETWWRKTSHKGCPVGKNIIFFPFHVLVWGLTKTLDRSWAPAIHTHFLRPRTPSHFSPWSCLLSIPSKINLPRGPGIPLASPVLETVGNRAICTDEGHGEGIQQKWWYQERNRTWGPGKKLRASPSLLVRIG